MHLKRLTFKPGLLLAAGLMVVGLAGCSGQPAAPAAQTSSNSEQPRWISQHPQRNDYVFGVASAEIYGSEANALERAREQARVDLLSRIRVAVSGTTETSNRMEMNNGQVTNMSEVLTQEARSRVKEVELPGMEVTETWINPNGKDAWAMAQLNRVEAERQLLGELQRTNQRLLERGLPQQGTKLERVRKVIPRLPDLARRNQLHQQLAFLAATDRVDAAQRKAVDELDAQIQSLLASLSFSVKGQNSLAERMRPELAEQLTAMGFNMVDSQADLQLHLSLSMDEVQRDRLHHRVAQASGQVVTPQ
ncbi:LPP20 family lipoprotein, partial [Marinospirillum sp.]|uniref:LPP20 family lipoprotein n=1 Tax=Marinospirillum sp. TaxID=2183934 RepID=UPI00287059F0